MPGNRVRTLLRSALWYLRAWNMNPIFTSIWKVPLHESWTPFYMAEISPEDVVKEYERIVKNGKKPAGVALVPSPKSRVVIVDLDIYRTDFGMSAEELALRFADRFVIAVTPRGGLRIAFTVPETGHLPYRFAVRWYGEQIGEGGGTAKHPWTMPPSASCVAEVSEGGRRKCKEVRQYYFMLPDGKRAKYPWNLPWKAPPQWTWEEAKDYLMTVLQAEVVEAELVGGGDLKISAPSGTLLVPVPCWRDLDDFREWLETDRHPALPPCVALALGYAVDESGEMVYTGRKVPHGLRFTMGATATYFLSSCIADFDPDDLIKFIGENLEDFPADAGEPLNTKLSRLLAKVGKMVVPRYAGLGSLATNLPPELCRKCPYRDACRSGLLTPDGEKHTNRYLPWIAFATAYWSSKWKRYC